jgi:hypothetical protein
VRKISGEPDRISGFQEHLLSFRPEAQVPFDADDEFFGARGMGQGVIDCPWWHDQLVDLGTVITTLDKQ